MKSEISYLEKLFGKISHVKSFSYNRTNRCLALKHDSGAGFVARVEDDRIVIKFAKENRIYAPMISEIGTYLGEPKIDGSVFSWPYVSNASPRQNLDDVLELKTVCLTSNTWEKGNEIYIHAKRKQLENLISVSESPFYKKLLKVDLPFTFLGYSKTQDGVCAQYEESIYWIREVMGKFYIYENSRKVVPEKLREMLEEKLGKAIPSKFVKRNGLVFDSAYILLRRHGAYSPFNRVPGSVRGKTGGL